MPGGDRTGPWGYGPRTGRAAGYCSGFDVPGYANRTAWTGAGRGLGRGRGFGRGRGWRNRYFAAGLPGWAPAVPPQAPDPEQELTALERQAKALSGELERINKRLDELRKKESAR
jgi:hypothetical protein